MNYGAAQTYCLDRLAISSGDTAKTAQVGNLLNGLRDRLVEEHALVIAVATLTVTANSQTVAAPTDFLRPLYVRNGKILVDPIDEYGYGLEEALTAAGFAASDATVVPLSYTFRPPATFYVWPTPTANTSLSMPYVQRPAAMVNSTDAITGIPSQYHDLLCELAIVRLSLSEGLWFEPSMEMQLTQELDARLKATRKRWAGPSQTRVKLKVYG